MGAPPANKLKEATGRQTGPAEKRIWDQVLTEFETEMLREHRAERDVAEVMALRRNLFQCRIAAHEHQPARPASRPFADRDAVAQLGIAASSRS